MSANVIDFQRQDEADGVSPRSAVAPLKSTLHQTRRVLLPLLSVADQAVVSGTSFATAVIVGRSCSQQQLGLYYLVLTFALALAGLHEAIISSPYAIFGARRQGRDLAEYGGSIWVHHWGLTAVSTLILLVVFAAFSFADSGNSFLSAAWAFLLAAPFLLLREAIRFFAFARLRVGTAIIVDALVAGLQLGGLVLLWCFGQLSVPRVFLVMGAACLLAGVSSFLFQPRSARFVRERVVVDWKENWSFSKWTMSSFLIGNTLPLVMPWLISFAAGTSATGVFGACATLLGATNILVLGMGNFLKPEAAKAYSSLGVGAMRRLLLAAAILFVFVFGAVCLAILLTGDWAMVLVFGPSFSGTGTILAVLAANVLVGSLGLIVSFGLLALGLSRVNFMSDICWSVVTILAALLLVFPYGAVGAAFASLIGTLATTAMRATSLNLAMRALQSPPESTHVSGARTTPPTVLPSRRTCNETLEIAR